MLYKNFLKLFLKLCINHRKALLLEFLFSNVAGLQACGKLSGVAIMTLEKDISEVAFCQRSTK